MAAPTVPPIPTGAAPQVPGIPTVPMVGALPPIPPSVTPELANALVPDVFRSLMTGAGAGLLALPERQMELEKQKQAMQIQKDEMDLRKQELQFRIDEQKRTTAGNQWKIYSQILANLPKGQPIPPQLLAQLQATWNAMMGGQVPLPTNPDGSINTDVLTGNTFHAWFTDPKNADSWRAMTPSERKDFARTNGWTDVPEEAMSMPVKAESAADFEKRREIELQRIDDMVARGFMSPEAAQEAYDRLNKQGIQKGLPELPPHDFMTPQGPMTAAMIAEKQAAAEYKTASIAKVEADAKLANAKARQIDATLDLKVEETRARIARIQEETRLATTKIQGQLSRNDTAGLRASLKAVQDRLKDLDRQLADQNRMYEQYTALPEGTGAGQLDPRGKAAALELILRRARDLSRTQKELQNQEQQLLNKLNPSQAGSPAPPGPAAAPGPHAPKQQPPDNMKSQANVAPVEWNGFLWFWDGQKWLWKAK